VQSYTAVAGQRRAYVPVNPMDELLVTTLLAAAAAVAAVTVGIHVLRTLAERRAAVRKEQSYKMIHALNAYSAWIECQRELPFTARSLDELTSPEPLTRARQIKRDFFPSLHPNIVRLLKSHHRLIEYLWEQSLMRLSQGAAWTPAYDDPVYKQLRAQQEDLIDEMVEQCRRLVGDTDRAWQRTGSDFAFSNSFSLSRPTSRA
jgi:hypothetical protein